MWRSKKFIVVALLAVLVLVGSIGGLAFAQTGGDGSQPKTLLARVAEILGIDQQKLEDAFAQARSEMQAEALDRYLQNLVEQGRITQEQADQYKAWMQAKPDLGPYKQQLRKWQQARPGIPPELKEWQQASPYMPIPGPFGHFGGRGFHPGMKWGGRYFRGR